MVRVASIGECMIELRHRGETDLELAYGGDTLNFAVYLARLTRGRDVSIDYVTALGEDPYSDAMLAMWRTEGIGCDLVARLPGRLPGLYTIRTDRRGERTFTYWRSASAARDLLRGEHALRIAEHLAGYDLLYLSGITLSILDPTQRETLMALADQVRAQGGRVVFDSNFRPGGWPDRHEARATFDRMLRRVDIALPTLDDDQALFDVPNAAACAGRLHELGVAEVAVKLGPLGCSLSADGRGVDVPAEPVGRVVDSTAAGDSFNAGYLAARLAGAGAEAAAVAGNRLAARVIAHPGAVIPLDAMADLVAEAT
jgi:2-dehydro-3-deoxygluconokinase